MGLIVNHNQKTIVRLETMTGTASKLQVTLKNIYYESLYCNKMGCSILIRQFYIYIHVSIVTVIR